MISEATRQILQSKCLALCEAFWLDCAYIAQILGPRRHYLAGYGAPTTSTPGQLRLSKDIVLFWHGDLSQEARLAFRNDLADTVRDIEREVTGKNAAPFQTNCHCKGIG